MSYAVLARKWRPRRFSELVGQEHVVRALTHALQQDKLHHALLFSGTRGVGKTTIARILARCLNCEKNGVTATPCGECASCREIDEGRFLDLAEIDAASSNSVESVRELQERLAYAPTRGRRKVYLFDEVHMFSKSAFNALLKTLEEPPPRVHFVLATTDPQKLPVTILSRCLQFHLKRLPAREIGRQLASILEQEGVAHDKAAVATLARAADGSMRDGLSLLDQAIAFGGGKLKDSEVLEMLGSLSRRDVLALLRAVAVGDTDGVLGALTALDEKAPDYDAVLEDLAGLLQRVALLQLVPGAAGDEDDAEALRTLAGDIAPEDVQLYYQIALQGRRDLDWAPDPRAGVEMTLLRMLVFRPDSGGEPKLQAKPAVAGTSAADEWAGALTQLGLRGPVAELARNCVWLGREGDEVRLRLEPRQEGLRSEGIERKLESALQGLWGAQTRLRIALGSGEGETLAQREARLQQDLRSRAEQAIADDPVVRDLQNRFGARVRPGSVEPLE